MRELWENFLSLWVGVYNWFWGVRGWRKIFKGKFLTVWDGELYIIDEISTKIVYKEWKEEYVVKECWFSR